MVIATVYGVAQLLVLASPTRSVRISTALLAIPLGVYGCGVAAGLLELAYTRIVADATGASLTEVVDTASYTIDPAIEEIVKLTPLLLAACNARIARQWGLTDYVVLGAGLGAGFGLLEALARFGLDADRAISHPAGGWAIPDSLQAPYIPGLEQVFSAWFPAPQGTLELGDFTPEAGTSPHLVYTTAAALGIGVLLSGRGWFRLLGPPLVAAATAHHMLSNYAAQRPTDHDATSPVDTFDGMLWVVPLLSLAVAAAIDLRRIRRSKRTVPGVVLHAELAGQSGFGALAGFAAWRVPWTALIALRFARMRRALLYAAARPPHPGADSLHRAVVWSARQIDASNHEDAWRYINFRTWRQAARSVRDRRRPWFILISLALALPSLVLLGVGSFPAAADLQEHFTSGNGQNILMAFGIAGLLWLGFQLVTLLRAWRATRAVALGETLAAVRFRTWTAAGGLTTGVLLLLRLQGGLEADEPVIRNLHLLEALNNFLAYLGFALILLSLLALFPPGGGLVLVGVEAGEVAVHAGAFGRLGILLMAASSGAGQPGEGVSRGSEEPEQTSAGEQKPDFRDAAFDDRKLTEYALNPEHPVGKNKARVIKSRTGLGQEDAAEVKRQIMDQVQRGGAQPGKGDQYGQRWIRDVELSGSNGSMTVRTAWIVDAETGATRFVTLSFP
ncbi:DUF6883 domain-containing protein [Streptomyces sp. NPDC019937]|uniref:DUF6883 domain-containing protein n=1 Tax=Streptomyces sp. NPDC019937 TaxID=3154787 RepID=UPI0033FFF209